MTSPAVPAFDHVFVVVMENHSAAQIIGSADALYLNSLAARYGLAARYTAVAHPSLPNYLALTGGSTFGVTTDCTDCFQNAPNLAADRLLPAGRTWRAYMESMPSPGFVGDAYPYLQKHDPFVYYDNIRNDPAQLAHVVPYSQLAADLAAAATTPALGWITPDVTHDMHDGTVAQGDTWLSQAVPALLASPAFTAQTTTRLATRSPRPLAWQPGQPSRSNSASTRGASPGPVSRAASR